MRLAWLLLAGAACSGGALPDPGDDVPEPREHHARFVGLWAVEQPAALCYWLGGQLLQASYVRGRRLT